MPRLPSPLSHTRPATSASPLPHLDRLDSPHRREYGRNEYGGLPVNHCILPISLCSRIFRRAVGPTFRLAWIPAYPYQFRVVRSAPKRSLADSSDESVPTEIHRSFRREPVVVHARRSPSNGRRGAAGSWLVSEPAGQVGGRARRHSLWTSQPSTTSTNARIPVG